MTEEQEALSGDLVPASEVNAAILDANDFANVPTDDSFKPDIWHNIKGSKEQQLALVSKATGPECAKIDNMLNQKMLIRNFLAHRCMLNGKTPGEVVQAIRVVLIDLDNNCFACVSDGVVSGLQLIIKHLGPGPWPDGIPVRVVHINTRQGNRLYKLVYDNLDT